MSKNLEKRGFNAPIAEPSAKPIEITTAKISILGVEIARNAEVGPRVPPAENFQNFSVDKFSLGLLQTIAKAESLDQPLLLEGEAAVGKSHTIEYLAHLANREVYRMSLNGQTDTTDLIGKWTPRTETLRQRLDDLLKHPEKCQSAVARELIEERAKIKKVRGEESAPEKEKPKIGLTREEMRMIAEKEDIEVPEGDWVWQDGDIPKQMKMGAWSVLDEVNTCEPQILVRLNALLERGGQLVLHEDGSKVVKRHENFRLFATVNPPGGRYKGRVPLSAEWISRWNYQNIGNLPKDIRASRLMVAEGVTMPEIKAEDLPFVTPEEIKKDKTLAEYYGPEWVRDLFTKYTEFAEKAKEMVEKGELAKDQHQIFDYDQRDDYRFREYLRKFREEDNMKEVIGDALAYCFYNKIKSPADRKKLKDVAEKLIKVDAPKNISSAEEGQEKPLNKIKAGLTGLLPKDLRDKLF